jgi:hypothetical protein
MHGKRCGAMTECAANQISNAAHGLIPCLFGSCICVIKDIITYIYSTLLRD